MTASAPKAIPTSIDTKLSTLTPFGAGIAGTPVTSGDSSPSVSVKYALSCVSSSFLRNFLRSVTGT